MSDTTDLAKFVELYKSLGIELKVNWGFNFLGKDGEEEIERYYISIGDESYNDAESTFHKKFIGYGGFHSVIVFDKEGKFLYQGFWE